MFNSSLFSYIYLYNYETEFPINSLLWFLNSHSTLSRKDRWWSESEEYMFAVQLKHEIEQMFSAYCRAGKGSGDRGVDGGSA